MTKDELRALILSEISNVAPDVDPSSLQPNDDIREALDFDSMDVMNLIIALHKKLSVDIPDRDAAKFVTLDGAIDYLAPKLRIMGGTTHE
ncbi:MAG: phosphopantetheine-binding protein [Alphaproteobacteria bacterium]